VKNQYNSLYWCSAWRQALDHHAIATNSVALGACGTWRQGSFYQAINARLEASEALGA